MNVILETERLRLREMTLDDLDFMAEMLGDAEVMRFYPERLTRDEARESIERQLARYQEFGHGLWLVVLKETERPIGRTGLIRQVVDGRDEDEIGYMFHRHFWRQGYASEAARGVRDYAFYRLNRSRVISLIRPMNIPSQRTALAVGLKPEKLTMHYDMEHLVYALARPAGGNAEAGR